MALTGMRMSSFAAVLLLLLSSTAASCRLDQVFACSDDASCATGGEGGTCEVSGYCSFPAPDCDSGQRYGALADGALAGQCVEPLGGSTTGGGTSATRTSDPSSSSTTIAGVTSLDPDSSTSRSTGLTEDGGSTTATARCADWWDCRWQRRRPFTISQLPLDEDLTGFPIPLPPPEDIDLASLRVIGADGEEWVHERESDMLWIRVPQLPANAELSATLYYDNPEAEDIADADAVWDDDFVAVWHLDDTLDVSGEGNDATATAKRVTYTPGIVGAATGFDGNSSRLQVPAAASLADLMDQGFTISVWALAEAPGAYHRMLDKADDSASTRGWSLLLDNTSDPPRLRLDVGAPGGEQVSYASISDVTDWNHYAVSAAFGDITMVINGEPAEVSSAPWPKKTSVESDSDIPLTIGARNGNTAFEVWTGSLDELRISRIRRSPAWLAATFHLAQPGAIEIGPEEQAPAD